MKRNIILSAITAGALMIMVFSCTKENSTDKPGTKQELTAYEIHVTQTLKDFKEKMEYVRANPYLKSGESVSADSAVWLLEATINYSHAFPNEFYDEFKTDSLTLTVNRNADGTVDLNELTNKYNEMKQAVAEVYHNSGYEEKGLAVVDLTKITMTENEIVINVEAITGKKGIDPGPGFGVDGPFVEGDDWWYGGILGHCYEPYVIADNAANQLWLATKDLVPDPNGNYYFTNPFYFTVQGGDPHLLRDQTPDNYLDYWLYYSVEGDPQIPFDEDEMLCVEWQEMNTYFIYFKGLMFSYLPYHYLPEVFNLYGYSVETYHGLDHQFFVDPINGYVHYLHKAEFTFGIKIGYAEGEGPVEL